MKRTTHKRLILVCCINVSTVATRLGYVDISVRIASHGVIV